jgi:hypothetical protein
MRHREAIRIPAFLEKPVPAAYNPTGLAARAIFLRDVATAWHKAGDSNTAEKIQRDAESQAKRFGHLGRP